MKGLWKEKNCSLIEKTKSPLSHRRGLQGEALAASFLKKAGYKILEKRFRFRLGEIDLIAQKKGTLAFIEVKTRSEAWENTALAALNPKKLLSLERTAYYYLKKNPKISEKFQEIEFLALSVSLSVKGPKVEVVRIEDY